MNEYINKANLYCEIAKLEELAIEKELEEVLKNDR